MGRTGKLKIREDLLNLWCKNVKRILTILDCTQEDLAKEVGVARTTVNSWMTHKHLPVIGFLASLRALEGMINACTYAWRKETALECWNEMNNDYLEKGLY